MGSSEDYLDRLLKTAMGDKTADENIEEAEDSETDDMESLLAMLENSESHEKNVEETDEIKKNEESSEEIGEFDFFLHDEEETLPEDEHEDLGDESNYNIEKEDDQEQEWELDESLIPGMDIIQEDNSFEFQEENSTEFQEDNSSEYQEDNSSKYQEDNSSKYQEEYPDEFLLENDISVDRENSPDNSEYEQDGDIAELMGLFGNMDNKEPDKYEEQELESENENENDDMLSLLQDVLGPEKGQREETPGMDMESEFLATENSESEDIFSDEKTETDSKRKKKAGKNKKDKKKEATEDQPDKVSFLQKIMILFTAEKEEIIPPAAEKSDEDKAFRENENTTENIEEKGKKKKEKKERKGKKGESEEGKRDDDSEDGNKKGKKKEKKKKSSVKPVKTPATLGKADRENLVKLSKKMVILIFVFGFSIFVLILMGVLYVPKDISEKNARAAYEKKDYVTVFTELNGYKLKGEDAKIFEEAKLILRMQRRLDSYKTYSDLGMNVEALNALITGLAVYDNTVSEVKDETIQNELLTRYSSVLQILSDVYGIDEQTARAVAEIENDTEYTEALQKITEGTYQPAEIETEAPAESAPAEGTPVEGDVAPEGTEGQNMQDVLPEEQEIIDMN